MPPKKVLKKANKREKEVHAVADDRDEAAMLVASSIEVEEIDTPKARRHRSENEPAPPASVELVSQPIEIVSPVISPTNLKAPTAPTKPIRGSERLNALTAIISTLPQTTDSGSIQDRSAVGTVLQYLKESEDQPTPLSNLSARMTAFPKPSSWRMCPNGENFESHIEPRFSEIEGPSQVSGRQLLETAWKTCHPTSDPIPASCEALLRAADVYLESARSQRNDPKSQGLLWVAKYPFPMLPSTSHADAFNTFKNWVRSWTGPQNETRDDDIDEVKSPLQHDQPLPTEEDTFTVRFSLRTQERERHEREAREKALQKNKGYFKHSDRVVLAFENSTVSNIAVISGPCGLGKSSLVEAVAKACNNYIIDIHTGIHRSAHNIEKTFSEATQARKLGAQRAAGESNLDRLHEQLAKMQAAAERNKPPVEPPKQTKAGLTKDALAKFFAPRPKKPAAPEVVTVVDAKIEEPIVVVASQPATVVDSAPSKSPLVLLDAGDVVFSDESGFHNAVCRLSASSKCPVIVTANTEYTDEELEATFGAGVPQFKLLPPDEFVLLFYLLCVVRCEAPNRSVEPQELLVFIRERAPHDIRGVINAIQWFYGTAKMRRVADLPSPFESTSHESQTIPDIAALCRNALEDLLLRLQTNLYYALDEEHINFDADGIFDDEEIRDFCSAQWTKTSSSSFADAWHSREVDLYGLEPTARPEAALALRTMMGGAARQQFMSDGWSVRIGDRVERDHLRHRCELGRNKRQRYFIHAAESSDALVDFLPPLRSACAA